MLGFCFKGGEEGKGRGLEAEGGVGTFFIFVAKRMYSLRMSSSRGERSSLDEGKVVVG